MPFSLPIFLAVLAIAAASAGVTAMLSVRWTRHRRYNQLREWCRLRDLELHRSPEQAPAMPRPLDRIDPPMRLRWLMRGDADIDRDGTGDGHILLLRGQTPTLTHNLLIRVLGVSAGGWPATALRPTSRTHSVIDGLSLFSYPSTMGVERFTLHGEHPGAARRLNESHIRGLLPQDVGLLVCGDALILDFSDRPFDQLEFDRMMGLARQLAAALPRLPSPAPAESGDQSSGPAPPR